MSVPESPRASSPAATPHRSESDQAGRPGNDTSRRRSAAGNSTAGEGGRQQAGPAAGQRTRRPPRVIDQRQGRFGIVHAWLFKKYGRKLGPTCLALYAALTTHADHKDGSCYPHQDTLAAEIGVDRRTVIRALKRLIAAGLVEKGRLVSAKGKFLGNAYALLLPPDAAAESGSCEVEEGCDFMAHAVWHKVTRSVTTCHTVCDNVSPGSHEQIQEQNQGARARTSARTSTPPDQAEIDRLTALWMDALCGGSPKFRRVQEAEFRDHAAALLASGWTAAELESTIRDRKGAQTEYPRRWRERLEEKGRPGGRPEETAAERTARQRRQRAEEIAEAEALRRTAEGQQLLDQLGKRVGRKP